MTINNQKGFTLVEGILTTLVIVVIAFVGYYVWNSQQDKNKEVTTATSVKKTTTTKPTDATKYWKITEWKVQAPESKKLKMLYAFPFDTKTAAGISSQELTDKDPQCRATNLAAGTIVRIKPDENYSITDKEADASDQTAKQYAESLPSSSYAYTGGYYYFYRGIQGLCGSKDVGDLVGETQDEIKAILPQLKSYE